MEIKVQPTISQSPGATQLAELITEDINNMAPGLGRFQRIQRLRSAGYAVTYSRR